MVQNLKFLLIIFYFLTDKHSNLSDGYRDSRDMRESDRERRDFRNEDHYDRRESRKYPQGKI